MTNQVGKKFAWVIKNFSSLQSERCYSDPILIGDCKWHLYIHPKGENKGDHLALYLEVDDHQSLPSGWRRYAKFRFSIVNQLSQDLSVQRDSKTQLWFDQKVPGWGFREMIPLTKLHAKDGGFLVNDELLIVAEVDVLEVIGPLDESKEASEHLKKEKQGDDGAESKDFLKKTPSVKESVDVNGFQVHPSQVESVRRIFKEHPDIAVEFRGKNQRLRTTCMNFLLSFMETLRQPIQELSYEDLEEADIALAYLKNASFKVDWLETELDQVKEKKETERAQALVKT
ncbi:unnamed protein product [Arabis nemorensis]|uniref:MATH domain-containing protein n=1 Tax=Arabis nemorensis TaxID=586526 RepID=A0A565BXV3_9BRAS|nr:unnamed protein product [Arabis nemorensis]